MFFNVGKKIKAWAKSIFTICFLSSVAGGIAFIAIHPFGYWYVDVGDVLVGLVIITIGSLLSWFTALWVYAFGENNENLKIIAANTLHVAQNQNNPSPVKTQNQNNPSPVKAEKVSRNLNFLGLPKD